MTSLHPDLADAIALADAALGEPPGSALLLEAGGAPAALGPVSHRYGALVGLCCPPSIEAVAARHETSLSFGEITADVELGVAVTRAGPSIARFRIGDRTPGTLHRLEGPLADVCRRALGLETEPCPRTPLDLLDASFADTVLTKILESDLGKAGPTWNEISRWHPLSDSVPMPAAELGRRRSDIATMSWPEVRDRLVGLNHVADTELTPSIAQWLDDGSLARWLFARFPEPEQLRADVCELLDRPTAHAFRAAHAPPRRRPS